MIKKNNELNDKDIIGTGSKIKVKLNNESVEYKLSVRGDTTGDGKVTVSDVSKLYQYLKGKIEIEEIYQEAGNVKGTDEVIKINDVSKLYQYIKGKINSLED